MSHSINPASARSRSYSEPITYAETEEAKFTIINAATRHSLEEVHEEFAKLRRRLVITMNRIQLFYSMLIERNQLLSNFKRGER